MGNGGALFSCLFSTIVKSLSVNISDKVRADTAPVWGRGTAQDTSQTLPLAQIGCVHPGAVDTCKSNYSHWVEPQTVDFYTADMYPFLLSDNNDNFSKYNKK